jgi:hypothetical protein
LALRVPRSSTACGARTISKRIWPDYSQNQNGFKAARCGDRDG